MVEKTNLEISNFVHLFPSFSSSSRTNQEVAIGFVRIYYAFQSTALLMEMIPTCFELCMNYDLLTGTAFNGNRPVLVLADGLLLSFPNNIFTSNSRETTNFSNNDIATEAGSETAQLTRTWTPRVGMGVN